MSVSASPSRLSPNDVGSKVISPVPSSSALEPSADLKPLADSKLSVDLKPSADLKSSGDLDPSLSGALTARDGSESHLEEEIRSLKEELSQIKVQSPSPVLEVLDTSKLPPSYKDNNSKEVKAIQYCKNLIQQYNHLCNTRRPLFIKPLNECQVKKLVCTTIVPTQLPYHELLDWPEIAEFVAGYLNYDFLKPPYELPATLYSPQTVIERLHGHCFEYSNVLCSMLIGAGYDAYVVSGYATREVCLADLSYNKCPFVEEDQVVYTAEQTKNVCRYTARPARWFKSEYELRMATKVQGQRKKEEDEKREAEEKARQLLEAPPPDDLEGRRVHSWVMVLAGRRDISQTFFIEPTTGVAHPTGWDQYLGIESLWNEKNYYINMQEEKELNYDIGDSRQWEYLFPGQDLHIKISPEELKEKKTTLALMGDTCADELFFDVPMSWCLPLYISRDDYDRKYPNGKRSRRYKYCLVEDFCRYLLPDGLVRKMYIYSDLAHQELRYTHCFYQDRSDRLESRLTHTATGKIVEKFGYGRDDAIREHHYLASSPGPERYHVLTFEPGKRTDEVYRREEDATTVKHFFRNRADRKILKETKFGPCGKVLENPKLLLPHPRPIETITEEFERNPEVPANDDIAKVTFNLCTDEIEIQYHVEDERIVASSRHFSKPPSWWDETQVLAWSPDLHSCFEANVLVGPKGELELYQMLIHLMKMESKTREITRLTERESRHIFKTRQKEEDKLELVKTYVQADRDAALRSVRLKLKAQAKANRILARSDILRDYLEPFMHRVGLDEISNKKQAIRIKDDCLRDLKEALISQANMIKEQFTKEMKIIETTQVWYHDHFTSLTQSDLMDFRAFLTQHLFTAHILEQRLISLKESAPLKYQDLYDTMCKDKRLEYFLI
ncbi:dynein regulatory complex subunit 7-like [Physella acuta]|uniref:dynein regulatory complex subunit 7-like n=1 Tax=Physella acuta TaxID=109671 RepID=UPI0027DD26CA|nr:dynein regulatory complex subunit 7-like [Physella acuta]